MKILHFIWLLAAGLLGLCAWLWRGLAGGASARLPRPAGAHGGGHYCTYPVYAKKDTQ